MRSLSVALATFNEENNIALCLNAIKSWVDEIIIVDGGSTDNTISIAKDYGARIIETNNPLIFHINKQKAVDACRCKWILQLDADEIITKDLQEEIDNVILDKSVKYNGYYVSRKNFFLGHWMKKGGLYPDYVVRLFIKGKGHFPCKTVHEQIVIDGNVGYLKNPILHFTYRSLSEYWKKANIYTDITAMQLKNKNVSLSVNSAITYYCVKPVETFLNIYVRNKGFLDGVLGLLFALFSGYHFAWAYYKYGHKVLKSKNNQ